MTGIDRIGTIFSAGAAQGTGADVTTGLLDLRGGFVGAEFIELTLVIGLHFRIGNHAGAFVGGGAFAAGIAVLILHRTSEITGAHFIDGQALPFRLTLRV